MAPEFQPTPSIMSPFGNPCCPLFTLTKMVNSSVWVVNPWTSFTCSGRTNPIPIHYLTCTLPTHPSTPPPHHCQKLLVMVLEPLMSCPHQPEKTVDNLSGVHLVVSCGFFVAWHMVQREPFTLCLHRRGLCGWRVEFLHVDDLKSKRKEKKKKNNLDH